MLAMKYCLKRQSEENQNNQMNISKTHLKVSNKNHLKSQQGKLDH